MSGMYLAQCETQKSLIAIGSIRWYYYNPKTICWNSLKATSEARSKVKNSGQLKWSCEAAHSLKASLIPNSGVSLSHLNIFEVGYFQRPDGL